MNVFNPRTYSADWETYVVDKLDRCVSAQKLMGFSGTLQKELDLPVHEDWNSLEFGLGVNYSFAQLWERIEAVTDRAMQLVREYDLDVVSMGSHPVEPMFFGGHVHVGTIHDEARAIHLANHLMRYMPAFGALAANSPASHERMGQFKSYRVRHGAGWAARPIAPRNPDLAQEEWGTDALPKLYGAPTLEIRIMDSASSRRLLAEMTTFVAAFVHHMGNNAEPREVSTQEYKEYLNNRWSAARDGLQATFSWDGKPTPVVQVLGKMLNMCEAQLQTLGASLTDLGLVSKMLQKRVCQADYLRPFIERYPEPYQLASVTNKLLRQWDIFDEYLETAPTLDPAPMLDEDMILAEHLDWVGDSTHFYRLRLPMWYPPAMADELLEDMVERGLITREVTSKYGTLLYRKTQEG